MEGLHVAVEDLIESGLIHGLKVGNLCISHLMYADDVLFLADCAEENIVNIKATFACFSLVSGLRINLNKSKAYGVGIRGQELHNFATLMGCGSGVFPFTYLGIPIGANMKLTYSWKPVIEKFDKRLSKWKANMLSIGGHSTLCSSVLGAVGTYYMSLFRLPVNVKKILESKRARFFWGSTSDHKRMHWINWDSTLACKAHGGIGIGSLDALNRGLLLKWRWRYVDCPNALWVSVLDNIHGPVAFSDWVKPGLMNSGTWHNINKCAQELDLQNIFHLHAFKKKVGNGITTHCFG